MLNIPTITKNLLVINLLAFVAMLVGKQVYGFDLNDVLGLHYFMASDFKVYQLLTYMFMHATWDHIFFNMFMLWMFGSLLERVWGSNRFLFYYIFCGIGAGVFQELVQCFSVYSMLNAQQPLGFIESFSIMHRLSESLNGLTTVGASGSLYALLLAFGMLFPNEKMFVIPIPVPIKAKWMVMGSILIELGLSVFLPGDTVAHLAHLGGMVFGFFLIRHWQRQTSPYGGQRSGASFVDSIKARWQQYAHSHRHADGQGSSRPANPDWDYNARKQATQEETDRILDKIRRSGYDSLTKEEKQTLFDQSKK